MEIGKLDEDSILQKTEDELVQPYFDKIKLPLTLRDEKRQVTTTEFKCVFVREDDSDLFLKRARIIHVLYPIQDYERIEETLSRDLDVEELCCPVEYRRHSLVLGPISKEEGEESQKYVAPNIEALEWNLKRRNQLVEKFNPSIKVWMTTYVTNLKKALLQERNKDKPPEPAGNEKKEERDDDDRDDDDGHERTPNDDRSDSLNPNNESYDASMDNRSDQLNPNNPNYQG